MKKLLTLAITVAGLFAATSATFACHCLWYEPRKR